MSASSSLEEIIRGVFVNLRTLVEYDRVTLVTGGADSPLTAYEAAGVDPGRLSQGSLPDELTPLHRQLGRTGQPVFTGPGSSPFRSWIGMPLVYRGQVTGGLILASRLPKAYSQPQVDLVQAFASQAALAIQNAHLFDQIRRGRERLRTLSQRLVQIQEEERRNIARELHDQVGQMLTGLKLVLEMNQRALQGQNHTLDEALELVNELMAQVRDISLDLRPAMLDDLGLLPALTWHIERYAAQTQIDIQLKHRGVENRRFDPGIETAAYRTIQEALTNVARHADTDQVEVRLWASDGALGLQIADQGRGFELESALESVDSSGLSGMQERIALLGGQLTIESRPEEGTLVTAELPLEGHLERRRARR